MNYIPTLGKNIDLGLVNLGKFDHVNRMITLSVITLSGFHCTMVVASSDPLGAYSKLIT